MTAGSLHSLQAVQGLQGAEKHAAGTTLPLAGNVQAVMHAVDEVDVGMPRRPEEDGVSCRFAGEGMGGSVGLAKVGFDLDNAAHPRLLGSGSHQQLSQQLAGYQVWGIEKKAPGTRTARRPRL